MVQHSIQESVMAHIRQIVRKSSGKIVPNIEVTNSALVPERIVLGTVINTVGPSIGSQCRQALTQPPPELGLKRVVIRSQAIRSDKKGRFCWIVCGLELICLQQSCRVRANIGNRERLRFPHSLLDAHVPLECVRKLQMRGEAINLVTRRHRRIDNGGSYRSPAK